MKKKTLVLFPLAAAALILGSCATGTTPASNPASTGTDSQGTSQVSDDTQEGTTVTAVTVTAAKTEVDIKEGTLQLTATVEGTGNPSQLVSWEVTVGSEFATVSSTGVLTLNALGEVTVRATSRADSTKFGEITITIIEAMNKVIDAQVPGITYKFLAKVVAKDLGTVVFGDETGLIFGYWGSNASKWDGLQLTDIAIGDVYEIEGQVYDYYGVKQIYGFNNKSGDTITNAAATFTKQEGVTINVDETPTPLTDEYIGLHYVVDAQTGKKSTAEWWNNSNIKFVSFTGQLKVTAGSSYNTYWFDIDGTETRLHSLDETAFTDLVENVTYDVVAVDNGYNTGNGYMNVIAVSVTRSETQVPFATIKGTEGADSVEEGATLQLLLDTNVTTGTFVWSSTNTDAATVDQDGLVTGVAPGTTVIKADNSEANISAQFELTVTSAAAVEIPSEGVLINTTTLAEAGFGSGEGSGYAKYDGVYQLGGLKVNVNNNMMKTSAAPYTTTYTELAYDLLQGRANSEYLIFETKIAKSASLTVDFYATYATEDPKYLPTLSVNGTAVEPTAPAKNDSGAYVGTSYKTGINYTSGTRSFTNVTLYKYTIVWDLSTFSDFKMTLANKDGADYLGDILVAPKA